MCLYIVRNDAAISAVPAQNRPLILNGLNLQECESCRALNLKTRADEIDLWFVNTWRKKSVNNAKTGRTYIQTPRLLLRGWKESDLPDFRAMNRDPQVMRYFTKPLTEEETDAFYLRIQEEFRELGYSLYAAETKAEGEFIGFVGFHMATFAASFTPCIEIGWRLKRAAWGQGFATEAAKACLDFGFGTLGIDRVYSFTSKVNRKSESVMQRIGMEKAMEFMHPNIGPDSPLCAHVLYRTDRDGYGEHSDAH
jgi:ribosomal-protein-alanine N-acetyltransferase